MSLVVYSFTDLKNAIENSLDNYIILGDTINFLPNNGIVIPTTTNELTIDGLDPITGDKNHVYDNISNAIVNALYTSGRTNPLLVTVTNAILHVRNTFGFLSALWDSSNSVVTLSFDNVELYGIQAAFNSFGTVHIKDSIMEIDRFDSTYDTQELCEANKIIFEGNVNIIHRGTADSFIWIANPNPSFTVRRNSNVNIRILNREMLYSDQYTVDILFEEGSIFNLETHSGLFYGIDLLGTQRARSFVIQENAQVYIRQTGTATTDTIPINQNLYVGNDVIFNVFQTVNNSYGLLGLFSLNATVNFDNPKNVVLYCTQGPMFRTSLGSASITINSPQVNYWTVAKSLDIAGHIDDEPNITFRKSDQSNVTITANYSFAIFSSVTSNIVSGDSGFPLNTTTFNLNNARVISFGILEAIIKDIKDNSLNVTGNTDNITEVRSTILGNTYDTISDNSGKFLFTLLDYLPVNTEVTMKFNKNFLHIYKTVYSIGSLSMKVNDKIFFNTRTIPLIQGLIKRRTDFKITITDTRENGSDFLLYAEVLNPLASLNDTIEDAVIFKEDDVTTILGPVKTLIYEGVGNKEVVTITELEYEELEGLLLKLEDYYNYNRGTYNTFVYWYLEELLEND